MWVVLTQGRHIRGSGCLRNHMPVFSSFGFVSSLHHPTTIVSLSSCLLYFVVLPTIIAYPSRILHTRSSATIFSAPSSPTPMGDHSVSPEESAENSIRPVDDDVQIFRGGCPDTIAANCAFSDDDEEGFSCDETADGSRNLPKTPAVEQREQKEMAGLNKTPALTSQFQPARADQGALLAHDRTLVYNPALYHHHQPGQVPGYHAPMPGYCPRIPGYRAPLPQLSMPGHYAPMPGHCPHILGYCPRMPGYRAPLPQAPMPGYQAPSPQAPMPGYYAPMSGYRAPLPGYQAAQPEDYRAVPDRVLGEQAGLPGGDGNQMDVAAGATRNNGSDAPVHGF